MFNPGHGGLGGARKIGLQKDGKKQERAGESIFLVPQSIHFVGLKIIDNIVYVQFLIHYDTPQYHIKLSLLLWNCFTVYLY